MHPPHVRAAALALIEQGLNDCEVSRRLGIPRRTILDWRRPTYVPRKPAVPRETCPRCWRAAKPIRFTRADYCELVGLYLGDGCLSEHARAVRLRITLDLKYPGIIHEAQALVQRCMPANRVDIDRKGTTGSCVNVSCYSVHWPCVLPQHGRRKKHERRIALEPWQLDLFEQAPWAFLRGCIRSDGSCFINRTEPYEYLSYDFSNRSEDIVRLFVRACELVDVEYRLTGGRHGRPWDVRINRRRSVERMLCHVGVKS